jgi:hypothetical protein
LVPIGANPLRFKTLRQVAVTGVGDADRELRCRSMLDRSEAFHRQGAAVGEQEAVAGLERAGGGQPRSGTKNGCSAVVSMSRPPTRSSWIRASRAKVCRTRLAASTPADAC